MQNTPKRLVVTSRLIKITPIPVRLFLKRMGFQKVIEIFINKSEGELIFQSAWAEKFRTNKNKVLDYWRRYGYLDEIKRTSRLTPENRVLDVGCGISTVLHFVEGERVGIDPLADEYKKMYDYPAEISIHKGFGEDITFPDGYFDTVFCTNVLDHSEEPNKVISEIARVLSTRGSFILTVDIFDQNSKRDPAHPHQFKKEDVLSLVKNNFQIIFEKISSGVGLYRYVVRDLKEDNKKELILILRKLE
jgi:ubiquinone/menaquinone biosynthesis C-methylase UbiE